MEERNANYFINNPVFLKYKKKFNLFGFKTTRYLKKVFINERIVEFPFVLQNIPEDKRLKILDLGCLESPIPLYLSSMGYKVTAVDFRTYPYVHPNLTFLSAELTSLPFEEESFEVVTCVSTIEHVGLGFYGDPPSLKNADAMACLEIHRVLKRKGILILTVPFGVAGQTSQQRIYDSTSLKRLLNMFLIEKKTFSANFEGKNNYWTEIGEDEASRITAMEDKTRCVCLVKARK